MGTSPRLLRNPSFQEVGQGAPQYHQAACGWNARLRAYDCTLGGFDNCPQLVPKKCRIVAAKASIEHEVGPRKGDDGGTP